MPIASDAIKCPTGYKLERSWIGKQSAKWPGLCEVSGSDGNTVDGWGTYPMDCFGYSCISAKAGGDGGLLDEKVCGNSGAKLAGGGCMHNCCVYLGPKK